MSLTDFEIIFSKSKSSLSIQRSIPFESKKSPTNTAILFFQSAFNEKKPLLLLLESTTSS